MKLLMVWGVISYTGRTRLKLSSGTLRANNYISDILGPKIPGFWAIHRTLRYLMQDNATLHVARTNLKWFRSRIILLIKWLAFSSDLNPIENLWAFMKREITVKRPKTLLKMARIILSSGQNFHQKTVQNLIISMPRRVQSCLDARGGPTKY